MRAPSFPRSAAKTRTAVQTADGTTLPATISGDAVQVGDARIVQPDQLVGDGVIHVVDTVLVPSS